MPSNDPSTEQTFWADDLYSYDIPTPATPRSFDLILNLIAILFAVQWVAIGGLVFALIYTPLAWLWMGFFLFLFSMIYYQARQRRRLAIRISEMQQRARQHTQASYIGSAIHVAGHPLLARDQRVVLALKEDQLSIFSYNSSTPIDILPMKALKSVYTVSYDDERVPHLEAIDSAAQALQLTFTRNEEPWTCLFRHMRKVRPIDWYHAIQKARLLTSSAHSPLI